jgi:hypothetical protein
MGYSWTLTPVPSPSLEEVGRERDEEKGNKRARPCGLALYLYRDIVLYT